MTSKQVREKLQAVVRECAGEPGMSVAKVFGIMADYGNNDAERGRLKDELEPEKTKRKSAR